MEKRRDIPWEILKSRWTFIGLNALDVAITYAALHVPLRPGQQQLIEGDPFAQFPLEQFGFAGLILSEIPYIASVFGLAYGLEKGSQVLKKRNYNKSAKVLEGISKSIVPLGNLFTFGAVLNNTVRTIRVFNGITY